MQKLSVIVPLAGQREWVVSYFENNGVHYFVPMESFITSEAPEDASEEQVGEIALLLAQELASQNGLIVDEVDGVYDFLSEDGTFLGWTVEFYQYEWDY